MPLNPILLVFELLKKFVAFFAVCDFIYVFFTLRLVKRCAVRGKTRKGHACGEKMGEQVKSDVDWSVEGKGFSGFLRRRALPLGVVFAALGVVYLVLAYLILNLWNYVPHYELSWAEQLGEFLMFKAVLMWEIPLLALSLFSVIFGIALLLFYFRVKRNRT